MKISDAVNVLDVLTGKLATEMGLNYLMTHMNSISSLSPCDKGMKVDPKDMYNKIRAQRDGCKETLEEYQALYPHRKNYSIKLGVMYDFGNYLDCTVCTEDAIDTPYAVTAYIKRHHTGISVIRGDLRGKMILDSIDLFYHYFGDESSYNPAFCSALSFKVNTSERDYGKHIEQVGEMIKFCNETVNNLGIDIKDVDDWYKKDGVTLL